MNGNSPRKLPNRKPIAGLQLGAGDHCLPGIEVVLPPGRHRSRIEARVLGHPVLLQLFQQLRFTNSNSSDFVKMRESTPSTPPSPPHTTAPSMGSKNEPFSMEECYAAGTNTPEMYSCILRHNICTGWHGIPRCPGSWRRDRCPCPWH